MPTATMPAPAAPAKSTPTQTPAATPAPAAPAQPARKSFEEDFNAEVAAVAPSKPSSSPAKPAAAEKSADTPAKPADAPEKAAETPPAETEDDGYGIPKPAAAKPAPAIPADQPVKAPELRAAYAKSKERVAELEKQLAEKAVKPVDDVERKTFTEQITTLQKQLEEATGIVRSAAYEQSKEYKDKYEAPFHEAWNHGAALAKEFTVMTTDGESRQANEEDFVEIMREPSESRAAQIAADKFGAGAASILNHRFKIRELNNARVKALQEYKATLAERTKTETETQAKAREAAEQARVQNTIRFKALNDEAVAKYPQFFAPEEGDEEGNKLLAKGYQDADAVFQGADMTPEQRVRAHSAMRNKAAAFGRLVHRIAKRDEMIAERDAIIKELRESAPGPGQVEGGEKPAGPLTIEQELMAEMKRGG